MTTALPKKLGIKDGMRTIFVNAPADVVEAIESPMLTVVSRLTGDFDYIHYFTRTQADLMDTFSTLKDHLKTTGMLWVSWPKGRKLASDLTMPKVIEIGYDRGLVESKCISINPTWSALKFTVPKKGKVYNNSYGTLKRESAR
jgi:hypothetical protein